MGSFRKVLLPIFDWLPFYVYLGGNQVASSPVTPEIALLPHPATLRRPAYRLAHPEISSVSLLHAGMHVAQKVRHACVTRAHTNRRS